MSVPSSKPLGSSSNPWYRTLGSPTRDEKILLGGSQEGVSGASSVANGEGGVGGAGGAGGSTVSSCGGVNLIEPLSDIALMCIEKICQYGRH